MVATSASVVIVPTSPERLNRNANLCDFVHEAFADRFGREHVSLTAASDARGSIREMGRGFVLLFGSSLPDECEFETISAVAHAQGVPVAFWTTDDPYEFDTSYKFVDAVDVVFTNDRWTERHYRFRRRQGIHHLPLAASREHFREVLPRDSDYMYDVFFCGVGFENRRRVVEGLNPILSKLETLVCGSEWPEMAPYVQNRRLSQHELLDAYQHSRIVLHLGRDHSYANSRFQITPSTPGPRAFEAAMAGGFQLAFGDRPEILEYFELGSEIALFDGLRDGQERIEYLLEHPEDRISMSRAAQRRACNDHTYANRINEICLRMEPLLPS